MQIHINSNTNKLNIYYTISIGCSFNKRIDVIFVFNQCLRLFRSVDRANVYANILGFSVGNVVSDH